jgi:methionyl-tRNA synthetase
MPSTYVTVAIPYVNADPHLGYAYELVQADIYARSRRAVGDEVRFLGGTDDHSLKNVLAAETAGVPTRDFVDQHAARFEALAEPLGLSFDDFIRTSSDSRHPVAVQRLWNAAAAAEDLYLRHYEGDYCVGCEQFYDADDLVDGVCPEHLRPTERVAEQNWFFRLSRYQAYIEDLIASDRLAIRPEAFRTEALNFVRSGLRDISVSRSVERARGWGIPVPGDPTQVIYVWFDALTNYISALDFGVPEAPAYERWWINADRRVHVVGKGTLRFHAVYWPAFLQSAGQPSPTRIQVHPYLTADGQKLSKSAGRQIDPAQVADEYGTDALRWFFAREVGETADTDFTRRRLVDRANDDLANALGNVTNRIATLVHRHGETISTGAQPLPGVVGLADAVCGAVADFRLRQATQLIVDAVAVLNRHLEETQPWALAKDPARRPELVGILDCQLTTARAIAAAVEPVVPDLARRLTRILGAEGEPPTPSPAFVRLELPGDAGEAPAVGPETTD